MTTNRIESILNELRTEEAELSGSLEAMKKDLKAREAQLTQVKKAIASLSGKATGAAAAQKPTASKEAVLAAMSEILTKNGPLTEDELRSRVEQHFSSQGIALTGFAMRFRSALKNSRFAKGVEGVTLSLASTPTA